MNKYKFPREFQKYCKISDTKIVVNFVDVFPDITTSPLEVIQNFNCNILFNNGMRIEINGYLNSKKRKYVLNFLYKLLNKKINKWRKVALINGGVIYRKKLYLATCDIDMFKIVTSDKIEYSIGFGIDDNIIFEVNFDDDENMTGLPEIIKKIKFIFNNYNKIKELMMDIIRKILSNDENRIKEFFDKLKKEKK
jgi:hypothetical protein